MTVQYIETEVNSDEEEKSINFTFEVEESTFMKQGEWQQDRFNVFIHDSLQYLKDKGMPIESIKTIKDKKL